MDTIDITSAEFSLDNKINNINDVISNTLVGGGFEFNTYIYIGIAILLIVIVFLIYKFYINRSKKVTFQDKLDDCYGGTCEL
jgi:hypothetical protein